MILEVKHLSKHFDVHHLQRRVVAFSELTFDLCAGEFVLVAGPNGVGKSSLLRCLYRTYLPVSGQALYHARDGTIDLARAADVDIAKLRREEIGHVTQFLRVRPRVSALEVVAEPLIAAGLSHTEAQERAARWLAALGLRRELWDAYPATFSGGEQQKVNLAHALIVPRRLLLLDEPTASLDPQARAALMEQLAQLKRSGVAMIGVFHHAEEVRHLVDKEVVLAQDAGRTTNESLRPASGVVSSRETGGDLDVVE
ncbi:MAG: ABC transporter [Candidatus Roseilinea sp.]|jgi:alpha-D-ribose 1-methylphosphonate 5-triphosphate synthase subunit PhnL|nr:MAG: ABC transporter [Candidatus Roseilinea sp.]